MDNSINIDGVNVDKDNLMRQLEAQGYDATINKKVPRYHLLSQNYDTNGVVLSGNGPHIHLLENAGFSVIAKLDKEDFRNMIDVFQTAYNEKWGWDD